MIRFQNIANGVPLMEVPFAVLIDADDTEWRDPFRLRQLTVTLLAQGCRYFVCFGRQGEDVHDLLDDIIVEKEYLEIVTTFHPDESREEVADFLLLCAAGDLANILVLVRDTDIWRFLKDLEAALESDAR